MMKELFFVFLLLAVAGCATKYGTITIEKDGETIKRLTKNKYALGIILVSQEIVKTPQELKAERKVQEKIKQDQQDRDIAFWVAMTCFTLCLLAVGFCIATEGWKLFGGYVIAFGVAGALAMKLPQFSDIAFWCLIGGGVIFLVTLLYKGKDLSAKKGVNKVTEFIKNRRNI